MLQSEAFLGLEEISPVLRCTNLVFGWNFDGGVDLKLIAINIRVLKDNMIVSHGVL